MREYSEIHAKYGKLTQEFIDMRSDRDRIKYENDRLRKALLANEALTEKAEAENLLLRQSRKERTVTLLRVEIKRLQSENERLICAISRMIEKHKQGEAQENDDCEIADDMARIGNEALASNEGKAKK